MKDCLGLFMLVLFSVELNISIYLTWNGMMACE